MSWVRYPKSKALAEGEGSEGVSVGRLQGLGAEHPTFSSIPRGQAGEEGGLYHISHTWRTRLCFAWKAPGERPKLSLFPACPTSVQKRMEGQAVGDVCEDTCHSVSVCHYQRFA